MTHEISAPTQQWTIKSLLEWSAAFLESRGIDEARLTVDLLLAHALSLDRLGLYLQFDRPLNPSELDRYRTLFRRRLAREPLQYILGETEFMGLRFQVDRRALIPRPETEILIERTLLCADRAGSAAPRILDIGTGAGNVAIALAVRLPAAMVTSIDRDPHALELARENLRRHACPNVTLQCVDIFTNALAGRQFDLVVSNPPYIALDEYMSLQPEVRDFEPRGALTDEGDGLGFVRRIVELAASLVGGGGFLLMEIGYGQGDSVLDIARQAGLADIVIHRDYSGIPRVFEGAVGRERV